jgi:hypothetical protein
VKEQLKMAKDIMVLDLTVIVNGAEYDLSDEFDVTGTSMEDAHELMTERLVAQLGSLDVKLDALDGGDHDTGCNYEAMPGFTASVDVYLDNAHLEVIGQGEVFLIKR